MFETESPGQVWSRMGSKERPARAALALLRYKSFQSHIVDISAHESKGSQRISRLSNRALARTVAEFVSNSNRPAVEGC
jgi:hypothetical protein